MTGERGSMTVAMTGVVATVILTGVAVAALAFSYGAKAQAEIAADAAALAAAVGTYPAAAADTPVAAARETASRNGARLTRCDCFVDERLRPRAVLVVVTVTTALPLFGSMAVRASSRAEFDPADWLGLASVP